MIICVAGLESLSLNHWEMDGCAFPQAFAKPVFVRPLTLPSRRTASILSAQGSIRPAYPKEK